MKLRKERPFLPARDRAHRGKDLFKEGKAEKERRREMEMGV